MKTQHIPLNNKYQIYETDADKSYDYFQAKAKEPLGEDMATTAFELMELGMMDKEISFDMDIPVDQISLMREQSIFPNIAKSHDYPLVLTDQDITDRVFSFLVEGEAFETLTPEVIATWLGVPVHTIKQILLKLGFEPGDKHK